MRATCSIEHSAEAYLAVLDPAAQRQAPAPTRKTGLLGRLMG